MMEFMSYFFAQWGLMMEIIMVGIVDYSQLIPNFEGQFTVSR